MKQNKNLWIGLGVGVIIIAIILAVTLGGKKKEAVIPEDNASAAMTDTQAPVKKSSSKKNSADISVLKAISPVDGATLTRGTTVTIAWTGPAECYDLGYRFNPKGDTMFNFIGKVCKTATGTFSYQWSTPINVAPGIYSLELRDSGSMRDGVDIVSFLFK